MKLRIFRGLVLTVMLMVMVVMPVSAGWGAQAADPPVEATSEIMGYLGIIMALAFLTETLVEFLCADLFLQFPKLTAYKWTQKYIAVAVGVAGAFIYQFDVLTLLADFLGVNLLHSPFGIFCTGVAIGKGSNYLHDLIMRFFRGKLNGLEQHEYAQDMIETWVRKAEQVTTAEGAGPVKKMWVEQRVEEADLGLSTEEADHLIEASVYRIKNA